MITRIFKEFLEWIAADVKNKNEAFSSKKYVLFRFLAWSSFANSKYLPGQPAWTLMLIIDTPSVYMDRPEHYSEGVIYFFELCSNLQEQGKPKMNPGIVTNRSP